MGATVIVTKRWIFGWASAGLITLGISAAASGCSAAARSSAQPTQSPTSANPATSSATNASPSRPPSPQAPPAGGSGTDPVLVAAGDIVSCSSPGDEATAGLLGEIVGTVAPLGDNAYENGSASEYADCYAPSWGKYKVRTRPAPGNHDYLTPGASGYFGYFGAAAGTPGKGYYSYNLGSWHIVVINSNCGEVGGCGAGSAQEQWLRGELARSTNSCTLAYWHHPLFSSGAEHGNHAEMRPIFQALYEHGAEVVLSGHEHNYERFAPQTPGGAQDTRRGIREFVVGTGGKSHYAFATVQPNSEVRNTGTFGVLKLTLHTNGYDWRFVPQAGKTFTDSGSGTCH